MLVPRGTRRSDSRGHGICAVGLRNAGGEMDEDLGLTLKIRLDKTKYAWSLYRNGIIEPIKFSVPIFSTEAAATAAGMEVLTRVSARAK
jgi:hypothetical protein